MLEAPANGRLECTGPDTDRTCEVRCLDFNSRLWSCGNFSRFLGVVMSLVPVQED